MHRLRICVAITLSAGTMAVARAEEPPTIEQTSKTLEAIAREVSIGASLASKAAADALLAPSNKPKFAAPKANDGESRGSDSVGGNAAALAAGAESANPGGSEVGTPLPVRKPKPVYGSGGKAYEAANGKKELANGKKDVAAAPAAPAPPSPAADDKKQATGKPQPGKAPEGAKPDSPKDGAKTDAATAKTDDKSKAAPAAAKKPSEVTEWPAQEIELAKARCTQLLKGLDAVTVPEAPFRKGECGAPAPVRLVSIGKNPEVALSPPALVTCDMVVGLSKWLKGDLQPLARKHLGADIVRIDAMSDYSCRRAYGRIANKLSEHGKANALDIRGFITANAKTAYVLEEWGQTRRDVLRKLAAAKAEAEKADAARLAAEKKAQDNLRDPKAVAAGDKSATPPAATPMASGGPAGGLAKTTIIDGLSKLTVTLPGAKPDDGEIRSADAPPAMGVAPRRLGGPKDGESGADEKPSAENNAKPAKDAKPGDKAALGNPIETGSVSPPSPRTATSRFLHEAHIAACRIFGTTLGPEANEAHRNHFHVDMAERKLTKICE
jgi:hypothetical protein